MRQRFRVDRQFPVPSNLPSAVERQSQRRLSFNGDCQCIYNSSLFDQESRLNLNKRKTDKGKALLKHQQPNVHKWRYDIVLQKFNSTCAFPQITIQVQNMFCLWFFPLDFTFSSFRLPTVDSPHLDIVFRVVPRVHQRLFANTPCSCQLLASSDTNGSIYA